MSGRWYRVVAVVSIATMAMGCMSKSRIVFRDTDPLAWNRGEGVVIMLPNSDTTMLYDLSFVLKVNSAFSCDSIPFLIKAESPDSISVVEKLSFHNYCTSETGITRSRELRIPYRTKVMLSKKGDYKFVIDSQLDRIEGVEGVGIVAEPSK